MLLDIYDRRVADLLLNDLCMGVFVWFSMISYGLIDSLLSTTVLYKFGETRW